MVDLTGRPERSHWSAEMELAKSRMSEGFKDIDMEFGPPEVVVDLISEPWREIEERDVHC